MVTLFDRGQIQLPRRPETLRNARDKDFLYTPTWSSQRFSLVTHSGRTVAFGCMIFVSDLHQSSTVVDSYNRQSFSRLHIDLNVLYLRCTYGTYLTYRTFSVRTVHFFLFELISQAIMLCQQVTNTSTTQVRNHSPVEISTCVFNS